MTGSRASNFLHSSDFPGVLDEARGSLLVSTYQAGQVGTFGIHDGKLDVSLEPFPVAMGIAVHPRKVVVGSRGILWQLDSAGSDLARRLEPVGKYDAALLTRSAHVTGNVQSHEMAFAGDELWMINTMFSCLTTIQPGYNFVPRWKPQFVSNCHVPGDRCHLNGLAVSGGRVKYVTAMAETDTPGGWREIKEKSGVLVDVPANEVVCRGFAMPHSPRVHLERIWVLDSGRGQLVTVDASTGKWDVVTTFPGYTRGLAFLGHFAFVGLSRIRETSVFGGLPIAEKRNELKCGLGVVDLRSGRQVATFQFVDCIEEIFDVQALPSVRCALLRGPQPTDDAADEIWLSPPPPPELRS